MHFSNSFDTSSQNESNNDLAEINIIPLVDVMLVLLIVFMVTAPLSIGGIKVDLPNSKAKSTTVDEDRIVLSVTKDGAYFIEKLEISQEALPERFTALFQYRKKKELYVRADTGVEYGRVIYAMSAAKQAGVKKLAMLTKSEKKSK